LALLLIVAFVLSASVLVAVRLHAPSPVATVTASMAATVAVPVAAVTLPWPTDGQSAIAVPSVGVDVTSGPEQSVPIASLTKMMTAYLILRDHPLGPDQDGPRIVMTPADVSDFNNDTVQDEANAQVTAGEILTERQLLEGLLVHSANNFADTLARWDAGSIPAFVAQMNVTAAKLGMDHTHYADPSGFDAASQSTAGDLLKVAVPDMDNPTFADIVKMTSVTLPVAGTISSYTPLIGFQGVIGVKSGFTTAAGGCDVVAVVRQVHDIPTLILSAVTGQTGPNVLAKAGFIALNLANHAATSVAITPVVHAGEVVAHVSAAGHTVAATAASTVNVLSWPGVTAEQVLVDGRTVRAGAKKGTKVGSAFVALGTQRIAIPVVLGRHLPEPTMLQRVF
jgi:D-alanyl-D-alanine carboxypeptidase (penicillin-binding protein 5/6)